LLLLFYSSSKKKISEIISIYLLLIYIQKACHLTQQ